MNNGTEIKFNKEQANHGIEELKQCQRELYEADKLFYKGIMALASAKGMNLILNEDAGINLYMPEKIVIECREEITTLIEEITTKIGLIEGFNEEPKEGPGQVQYRKTPEEVELTEETVRKPIQALYAPPGVGNPIEGDATIQPLYGVPTPGQPIEGKIPGPIQALYAPPGVSVPIEGDATIQPLYGVPTPGQPIEGNIPGPIQALYAPPGIGNPIEGGAVIQPLYGVPTPIQPIEGNIPGPIQALYAPPGIGNPIEVDPVIQPLYGVPTPIQPIEGEIPGPIQALYAPPGIGNPIEVDPVIQPLYGVPTPIQPIVEEIKVPIQSLYAPPGIGDSGMAPMPEYETVPNTGIPGVIETNYVSKHPKLIGGLAATIGLFGIPTMLSDDFDEEEELRINGKED